jgi:hypothetical protein
MTSSLSAVLPARIGFYRRYPNLTNLWLELKSATTCQFTTKRRAFLRAHDNPKDLDVSNTSHCGWHLSLPAQLIDGSIGDRVSCFARRANVYGTLGIHCHVVHYNNKPSNAGEPLIAVIRMFRIVGSAHAFLAKDLIR